MKIQKFFPIYLLICFCIAANLVYMYSTTCGEGRYARYSGFQYSGWREEARLFDNMEESEAINILNREATWYAYLAAVDLNASNVADTQWNALQNWSEIDWNKRVLQREVETENVLPLDMHKRYNNFVSRIYYRNEYKDFLETIQKQAESLNSMSLFTDMTGFSGKNIKATASAYQGLEKLKLEIDYSPAVIVGTDTVFLDVMIIILVVIMGWQIFFKEKNEGIYSLICCTKNGKLELYITKISCFFLLLIIIVFLLYGSQIGMMLFHYGLGNLTAPIQSETLFRDCVYEITIGTYFICFIIIKCLAMSCYGSCFLMCYAVCKRFGMSVAAYVMIVFLEYSLYAKIEMVSSWNIVKYMNLYAVLDAVSWFSAYRNINFFSRPISAEAGRLLFTGLIIILGCIIGGIAFAKNQLERQKKSLSVIKFEKWWNGWIADFFHQGIQLRHHEFGKLWRICKGSMLFLVAIIYAFCNIKKIPQDTFNTDTLAYQYYITQLLGPYTQEKELYLRTEELFFALEDDVAIEVREKRAKGEITQKEYDEWHENRQKIIDARKDGFLRVQNQELIVKKTANYSKKAGFVDEDQIHYLLQDDKKQYIMSFLILFIVSVISCSLFGIEYESNMDRLLISTKNGKNNIMRIKIVVNLLYAIGVYAIITILYYTTIVTTMKRVDFDIALASISAYTALQVDITIKEFMILLFCVRGVLVIVCSLSAAVITTYMKQTIPAMILNLLLWGVPCLIGYMGISLSWMSLSAGMFLQIEFRVGDMQRLLFYSVYIALITIIMIVYLIQKQRDKRRNYHG